ncbi:uncharacterized protein LOC114937418 [Nylanderia fulva]|uniref:uncharacterized protein LOC114937418 n=1 Tax=Nylanderia fulva TaxID=613905 RepID=UPI0010FB0325|nr:uncharacterized protein LOC114937418 [Nylanderia fulva]
MSFSEPSVYYEMSAIELVERIFEFEDLTWKNNILEMPPKEILLSSLSICKDEKRDAFEFNKLNQSIGRPNNIKFAVGMIVKHNKNESHESTNGIRGVIVGWHKNKFGLKKIFTSKSYEYRYKILFYCYLRPFNTYSYYAFLEASTYEQPHYIILTEKNTLCFINEDALTLTTGWVENYEIGHYFCKFEDTHYVPNKMMAELYPHDAAIIEEKNNIKYGIQMANYKHKRSN